MQKRFFDLLPIMSLLLLISLYKPVTPQSMKPDCFCQMIWKQPYGPNRQCFIIPLIWMWTVRGRIWITEAVNYRNYNNDSTKFLHHPQGDRVMILEDTDQDGKADTSKIFVQDKDLLSPVGIAVIGNKVIVSCSPNLIIYTDENGDDKPDKKEIFLTGFGGKDHDHSLHAVTAGPDGNWYFNVGNAGPHIGNR